MPRISCEACSQQSPTWVTWQASQGDPHHFCDNDCLRQWLSRSRATVLAALLADLPVARGLAPEFTDWPHPELPPHLLPVRFVDMDAGTQLSQVVLRCPRCHGRALDVTRLTLDPCRGFFARIFFHCATCHQHAPGVSCRPVMLLASHRGESFLAWDVGNHHEKEGGAGP